MGRRAAPSEVRPVHPVADLFPMLGDDELAELAADIAERGLLHPVVLDVDGRVLDGRNRLAACQIAGVEPELVTYDGDDPAGYALAVNIARRHLTTGARAVIVERARRLNGAAWGSQEESARSGGFSPQRLRDAGLVLDNAPELADAVIAGISPLSTAVEEARGRKQAATSIEAQMARLRADAPDLADLVAEERLTLEGALGELKQRETERKRQIRDSSQSLATCVQYAALILAHADARKALSDLFDQSVCGVPFEVTAQSITQAAENLHSLTEEWNDQ